MGSKIIIVLDCGATTISVSAIDSKGNIVMTESYPNSPVKQPGKNSELLIWDTDEIWAKICKASRKVCKHIDKKNIIGVTVTTFGADGTFVDSLGNLIYPVISWQCKRTEGLIKELGKDINYKEVYELTGYKPIYFNTLYRILWLRKNAPHTFKKAGKWLMMPGIINHRLTGRFSIDVTSASTTMAMNMKDKTWSGKMLSLIGVDSSIFPDWVEPGNSAGKVTKKASLETGLPEGTDVLAAGHDTQFALVGSGAKQDEVVLSSGTWEILIVRAREFKPSQNTYNNGVIFESDAQKGLWNPQLLMIGSGVLEWVKKNIYGFDSSAGSVYEKLIAEAGKVSPGSNQLIFTPGFVQGTGPMQKYKIPGMLSGLTLNTTRAEIYRSALEGLSFQLKSALEVIKASINFSPKSIRVAGGGAKNKLWNQIRADVTGLPVIITSQKEITALGAALIGFVGKGVYKSLTAALDNINFKEEVVEPSKHKKEYIKPYEKFIKLHSRGRS